MRLISIVMLLFLLSAFAIGTKLSGDIEYEVLDASINNASKVIENINISTESVIIKDVNIDGFYLIIEKYIKFIGTFCIEIMRMGVKFGYDNPNYFSPETIINVTKIICWLIIISLLIKPIFYIMVFIVMTIIMIKDKVKKIK